MISLIYGILKTKQRNNNNLTETVIDTENKLVVAREDREREINDRVKDVQSFYYKINEL